VSQVGYDPRVTMTHDAEVAKPGRRGLLSSLSFAVATGLGSGYSPVVPGTAGSLVGLILFLPVHALPAAAMLGALAVLVALGIASASHVARQVGVEDPGIVVVDEVAGMWISLLFLPFTPFTAAAAFVIFRVLDVVKPFPARRLEDLPGGYGIMCDDLMAGAYTNLLVRGLLFVWPGV
jgi:phosphatidylglycerophosphatase A